MKYFNRPCPVCGELLKEGEDIVVCPECATPHHRSCWLETGHCINRDKHSESYTWEPEKTTDIPASESAPPEEENSDVKICHICSSENPASALHCGNCGALFGSNNTVTCPTCGHSNPSGAPICVRCSAPLPNGNPYTSFFNSMGVDENEIIGETKASDLAVYTGFKAKNYLPKFRKIAAKKLTFNWAAFMLGPCWFFFRKLYKLAVILTVVFASVSLLTYNLQSSAYNLAQEYTEICESFVDENGMISEENIPALESEANAYLKKMAKPLLILLAVAVAERIACALIADSELFKKAKSDIARVSASDTSGENMRKMLISRMGNPSILSFLAGYFAGNLVLWLMTSIGLSFIQ